jgi:hypothetical protein
VAAVLAKSNVPWERPGLLELLFKVAHSRHGTPEQRTEIFRAAKERELTEGFEQKIDAAIVDLCDKLQGGQ